MPHDENIHQSLSNYRIKKKKSFCSVYSKTLKGYLKLKTVLVAPQEHTLKNISGGEREARKWKFSNKMLGITELLNGMILSALNISSRGFAFGFLKRPRNNGDVFLTYKPMINPLISMAPLPTIFKIRCLGFVSVSDA